ncbi:putative toxin-antitoxin system toxin component, PIN family [bacterium]|nr:putative toxin-antitoxin system toxin component, PIN family [bacterium]
MRASRLVLDTHVALEAFLWQSPRHAALRAAAAAGETQLLASVETLDEWRRVLSYSDLKLSAEQQAKALIDYQQACLCIAPLLETSALPRCADPDDQKFLILCVAGAATALLTRDKKLLKIGRHAYYRSRFQTIAPERYILQDAQAVAGISLGS